MPIRLALVFLLSRRCNLECHYCNVDAGPHVREQLDARLFEAWISSVASLNDVRCSIQLHGGEPLLLRPAPEVFASIARNSVVQNESATLDSISLVTNGTLLSERRGHRLDAAGIDLNVSLDGPQATHDRNRVNSSGRGSYADAVRGIDALRKIGIDPPLICVASGPAEIVEAYDHFVDVGARRFKINPVRPEGRGIEIASRRSVSTSNEISLAFLEVARRIAKHNSEHRLVPIIEENTHSVMAHAIDLPNKARTWTILVDDKNVAWGHPGGWGVEHMRLSQGEVPSAAMLDEMLSPTGTSLADAEPAERHRLVKDRQRETMRPCADCADPFWCTLFKPLTSRDGQFDNPDCRWRIDLEVLLKQYWDAEPEGAQWVLRGAIPASEADHGGT